MRFTTLDVFRGMTVFLMIVVNTPGSGAEPFSPLLHAEWHGFTLTDLVFPSFLFAVGNAISLSSKNKVPGKIIRRMLLIFVIGYLLNWFTSIHFTDDGSISARPFFSLRILGVLQRIALAYGIAALLALYLSEKKLVAISVVFLVGYWILLKVFGVEGMEYSVEGNVVRSIDLAVIGEARMYRELNTAFDPEGLLSTIPSVVNVLLGYLTGKLVQRHGKTYECSAKLLIGGGVLIVAALLWSVEFPINKKLWTSPFALLTSGIAMSTIGILLYYYEIRGAKFGAYFFQVFGRNPLFIYILSDIFAVAFRAPVEPGVNVYAWFNITIFQQLAPGPWGSLLFAVFFALLCWIVGYFLDKRKIYIRV